MISDSESWVSEIVDGRCGCMRVKTCLGKMTCVSWVFACFVLVMLDGSRTITDPKVALAALQQLQCSDGELIPFRQLSEL